MDFSRIKVIAFDADDTLWDCQSHFERVERLFVSEMAPWGTEESLAEALLDTERSNMASLGYGSKAFCISLMETAFRVSDGAVDNARLQRLLAAGKALFTLPTTPLPQVRETLAQLRETGRWRLVAFSKGDLLEQENKLQRSGLLPLFDEVEIPSVKEVPQFRQLCRRLGIAPQELLMVGNSFKSDIAPVLEIGGYGILIPFHLMWKLEEAEPFEHPHLKTINAFSELKALIFKDM